MNRFCAYFLRIFAAYYWAAYSLHHKVFLRPGKPLKHSKLIVVGSFRAGGAGKTPFCLWLAKHLMEKSKTVAVLCHQQAFDEIQMYRHHLEEQIHLRQAKVIATKNRYKAAHQLDHKAKNAPDFILCDDGFEDSRLKPDAIFRLDWETPPTDVQQLIPAGNFRSLLQDHFHEERQTSVLRCYGINPDVVFHIDSIANSQGEFPLYGRSIAICGLGDPKRFISDLRRAELIPYKTVIRPDHDRNFEKKVYEILQENGKDNIIISEKDAFRLSSDILENPRIFVARQKVDIRKKIIL